MDLSATCQEEEIGRTSVRTVNGWDRIGKIPHEVNRREAKFTVGLQIGPASDKEKPATGIKFTLGELRNLTAGAQADTVSLLDRFDTLDLGPV
jgi:hypothetical protein